ncbi:MAG: TetR/AcrR family transcriptional regulator [Gemmatimonadales bacterium]
MTQADLTRQRLVRAALELFTAQGYHVTTTPQIARKAGVAEGTIYRHFDGKQHLLNELFRGAARWALKLIREADGAKVSPREKLAALARGLVEGATREPAVVRLFFLVRPAPPGLLDDRSKEAAREFRAGLESLVAQGKADGSVKTGPAEIWAAVWLSVVTLALDRVSARDWPETHAGVGQTLAAAWDAIALAPVSSPSPNISHSPLSPPAPA